MTLIAPWWIYVLTFLYAVYWHMWLKVRKFPELDRIRVFIQSLLIGALITGFALFTWTGP